jgi:beta-galactosidase
MDLGSSGWFKDPGMWAEMKRLRTLDEALLKEPTPFRPEVAAVIDERSMLRVAAGGTLVTRPAVYDARAALGRMGAPYGQYLLDDVLDRRVQAKLYVLLNAWCLSSDQRQRLLHAMQGAARIWCYAPGYFEDSVGWDERIASCQRGQSKEPAASAEAMRQLTGFRLTPITPKNAWATPTEAGKRLGLLQRFGVEKPPRPLFAAADATGDEILATYADGSAAVAMRRTPDGPSIFVGVPGLTSELLRIAAQSSGVHLFTSTDCNVYASGRFVAVHASQDGPLLIDVGRPGPIEDLLSGAKLGEGPKITLPLKRGDTKVLSY